MVNLVMYILAKEGKTQLVSWLAQQLEGTNGTYSVEPGFVYV